MGELDQIVSTSAVAVSTTAVQLPAEPNMDRQSILIQNIGPDAVYLGGEDVSAENGIQLAAGASFGQDGVKAQVDFYAICDTGDSADVRVMELS